MHTCQLHTGEVKTFLWTCVSFNVLFFSFLALKMNKLHFRKSKNSKLNNKGDETWFEDCLVKKKKNLDKKREKKSSKGRVLSSAGWTDGGWRLCQRAERPDAMGNMM